MAILFSGIVMSHYTHHNLSPVTQILMQQTLRTVAFLCGEFCLCGPVGAGRQPVAQPHLLSPTENSVEPHTSLPYLLFITLAFKFYNVPNS